MSSGYPGHLGGAGPSSGHQSNPPYPSMTSRGNTPGGTHPPPSQLLPPSPAPSPQPHSPQVSSQKAVGSTGSQKAKWYFSPDRLSNTPSVEAGIPIEKELSYRQQAANFIQDMGQRLKVTQLCINTAIVYMQRFYMFHSFTKFHRNTIAAASLFLAAKVEEQPRKLEHVIKVAHICLHRDQPQLDSRSDAYIEQAQELVINENILLQTLGFDVAIDHPHTHVVHCCQLVKASKELAQTSYFMATNSLHLTTMCLRHPPKIVACVCIHLACKWSNYKIPLSKLKKEWFMHVLEPNWNMDSATTLNLLEELTNEFLTIFEQCPSRLKKKIMASTQATKQEEERQKNSNDQPGNYQPDLSLHNESANAGSNPSIMLGQQQKPKHASSSQKQTSSSLAHVQRHSSNPSNMQNPTTHGVHTPSGAFHPSVSVPGSHPSTHAQGNIPSSSKHGTHVSSSHPSRSHGHPLANVDKSMRSSSTHRLGDKHSASKLNIPGGSNSNSGSRHQLQSQQQQQQLDPNRHPMSMAAYKDRQGPPSSGASNSSLNANMQSSQSRSSSASVGDPMHQTRDNRKRMEQSHHSNAKKAHLSNVQNPLLIPGSHSGPTSSNTQTTGELISPHQSEKNRQQNMPGIDNSFNSSQASQNKYIGSRNSSNSSQQSQSSRSWQQPPNSSRTSTTHNTADTSRIQQPAQVKKSIFDIDSPPPVPNQPKPFDKMSLDRTESLEPGEIIDEDSQEFHKQKFQGQFSGTIGTAPSTTITPLQQRLFGSTGQSKSTSQTLAKSTSNVKEQKDALQKSDRKYNNPLFSGTPSSMKTQSPVKQGKLNVIGSSNTLDPIKQEMSAVNRRSLFSPPSDTEAQTGGSQASPYKVVKSPVNNNRQGGTNRDGRRTISNSSTGSPRFKQDNIKAENIDAYITEKGDSSLNKQETINMSIENSDQSGINRNSNMLKSMMKSEIDDRAIPDHTESQSYDSPSERHKKHKKKDKKHKKEKKKDHDKDKERSERKEKDRSSSKHHSHSKHSSDFHGSEHHSQHKLSSNSHHHSKHHRNHTQDQNAMSNASGNLNQLSTSSMTPTGPMAYDANTPQIDTPTSTTSSGLKLKIKLPPPPGGTPVSSQGNNSKAPSIAPLRISLGGSSDQNRKRSHKGDGHGGPASKMSRVLGTPLESEHKFLASKGLSHSSKSHKKVK